jgi:hypothetical protein
LCTDYIPNSTDLGTVSYSAHVVNIRVRGLDIFEKL